jgi:hypothetical protein
MMDSLPDLVVTHERITDQKAPFWNLRGLIYQGGVKVLNTKKTSLSDFSKLPLVANRIWLVESIINYFEECMEIGFSEQTIRTHIYRLRRFISFCEESSLTLDTVEAIQTAYFLYAEDLYLQLQRKDGCKNGYSLAVHTGTILSKATESLRIHVKNTRLKKPNKSPRALSREADKANLTDSSKIACLIYDISENFDSNTLVENKFPIFVKIRTGLIDAGKLNMTPQVINAKRILNKSLVFPQSQTKHAFNLKVSSECLFFLAMTTCNPQSAFNLKREGFSFKPLGETYQVRIYKHRRQGEIIFTIPKVYRAKFERYLEFLNLHASDSEWLFPHINLEGEFSKAKSSRWDTLRDVTKRYKLAWVAPRSFRKTSLNLLLRLTANENLVSEIANHALETFQENYKLPSQQRALVEITRFWDSKVSLFNTHCTGVPDPVESKPNLIVEPDCLTPSGCFWCKHFRDENSFDYIWNLHSYRLLKKIESSSYIGEGIKPANLVIEQLNKKINWFKSSDVKEHMEWIEEAEIRMIEGYYHSNWEFKILKYEV